MAGFGYHEMATNRPGSLSLLLACVYLALLFHFQQLALARLGLGPAWVFSLIVGTFLGGLINIPCWIRHHQELVMTVHPGLFGFAWLRPTVMRRLRRQVVAVNLGGFVLPVVLSLLALQRLLEVGVGGVPLLLCFGWVVIISFLSSEAVPGVGVVMSPLLPALTSALLASWLTPQVAPLVAYLCGVLGVLVGADLLRLPALLRSGADFVSLGGAGTFDGIVMTGLLSSMLA